MKKLSLVLAAVFAVLMLCSCSGAKEGSKAENTKSLAQVFKDIRSKVEIDNFNEYKSGDSLDRFYGLTDKDYTEFAGGINSTGTNQEEILLGRLYQFHGSLLRLVTEVRAVDGVLSGRNVQRIETDGIRGYARLPVFQENDRLRERFPALRIADIAGKDDGPGLGQSREGQQDQDGRNEDASERNHLPVRALAADWPAR